MGMMVRNGSAHDARDPRSRHGWRIPLLAALRSIAEGNPHAALPLLERAHRLGPDVPEVCLAYGRELVRRGDSHGIELLERAHRDAPDLSAATCELARFLSDADDHERAIAIATEGLERHPADPLLRIVHAEVALAAGDIDAAVASARKALALAITDAHQHAANAVLARCENHVGLLLASTGELQQALFAFKRARDHDRLWATPITNMGTTFARLGHHRHALRLFRSAIDLVPDDSLLHYNLGLEHMALGEWREARAVLERAAGLLFASEPRALAAQCQRTLALVYRELGSHARAVRALEVASHLVGAGADIWAELARAHVACGELGKARRAARIALALCPDSALVREAWSEYARARRRKRARGGMG